MTFTERNFPPPEPAGEAIPDGVRVSLLNWFAQYGVASATDLWADYCQHEGYGTFDEAADDIGRRFGVPARSRFQDTMAEHFKREKSRGVGSPGTDYNAEPALRALPAQQFLDVLEMVAQQAGYESYLPIEEINRLFKKRGIYYRFADDGTAQWYGDESAYVTVVRPALDALTDDRLAGARSEFDAALVHMRNGTFKDLEDAVEEAAKSVESAMKVVLVEHGETLTGKETARPLFQKLSAAGIVSAEADNAVLAPSRLRNAFGGHGSGAQPRQVPLDIAELAVRSAASAVCYLAICLP